MGQVGTSWSRGTSGTRRGGSSDLSGTSGTRRRGYKWDKDKGSVHLNHSTCPKWDYKAVENSFLKSHSHVKHLLDWTEFERAFLNCVSTGLARKKNEGPFKSRNSCRQSGGKVGEEGMMTIQRT